MNSNEEVSLFNVPIHAHAVMDVIRERLVKDKTLNKQTNLQAEDIMDALSWSWKLLISSLMVYCTGRSMVHPWAVQSQWWHQTCSLGT